jgi:pectinesterase
VPRPFTFIGFTSACLFLAFHALGAERASTAIPVLPPDLTVAIDGTGNFRTIQEAVASIPRANRERIIVFVKDGVYREKVRIDPSCITLRGQSRSGTRIEFAQGANEFRDQPDDLGRAVININGDDFVLENLTVQNTHGVIGVHAFAVFGRGDRTVIQDCDILSQGNDTLSLWRTGNGQYSEDAAAHTNPNGRYYHARLKVCGSVDFICPRGWCYITDSDITAVNPRAEAAMWHDGSRDRDMKFVLRDCRFDGVEGWRFARHHHDAQFFLVDCTFSKTMRDLAPKRVIYPLDGGTPTEADLKRNRDAEKSNLWGERFYFFNCHRVDGDYAWFKDNLATAPGAPQPSQITAKWTFAGQWDPENKSGPVVKAVFHQESRFEVTFSESVTVKGKPRLRLRSGNEIDYVSGSGSSTLRFDVAAKPDSLPEKITLHGGAIIASEAAATLRPAQLTLP